MSNTGVLNEMANTGVVDKMANTRAVDEMTRARTRLSELVQDGSVEDLDSFLQDHQSDLSDLLNPSQRSPLMAACQLKRGDVVELLLRHGAHPDCGTDDDGKTPLHCACDHDDWNSDIVRRLLEAGASVDAQTSDGRTALHCASSHTNVDVVSLLLGHYADVDREDGKRETPLCKTTISAVATLLVNAGSDINCNFGQPLLSAVENGHFEVVDMLIREGANLKCDPLLDIAKRKKYHKIAGLLSRAGLSIKARLKSKPAISKKARQSNYYKRKRKQEAQSEKAASSFDTSIAMPLNVRMREMGPVIGHVNLVKHTAIH